ncbi:uncharacterized protein LOC110846546 isoform X2 [Folsomia candida]|uniref:uncharacterized protein LOC110846546 isoform X2 n=1 Tax=Folsomia candida TaxID=158441 RepID=UPI0016051BF5|nr:uncharacterized protein LOC110846546 isoform X2 [Folsomia candida]
MSPTMDTLEEGLQCRSAIVATTKPPLLTLNPGNQTVGDCRLLSVTRLAADHSVQQVPNSFSKSWPVNRTKFLVRNARKLGTTSLPSMTLHLSQNNNSSDKCISSLSKPTNSSPLSPLPSPLQSNITGHDAIVINTAPSNKLHPFNDNHPWLDLKRTKLFLEKKFPLAVKYILTYPLVVICLWALLYIFWGKLAFPESGSLFALLALEVSAIFLVCNYPRSCCLFAGFSSTSGNVLCWVTFEKCTQNKCCKEFESGDFFSFKRNFSCDPFDERGVRGQYDQHSQVQKCGSFSCNRKLHYRSGVCGFIRILYSWIFSCLGCIDGILAICMAECALGFIFGNEEMEAGLVKGLAEVTLGGVFGIFWGGLSGVLLAHENDPDIKTIAVFSGGVMSLIGLSKIGYPRGGPLGTFLGAFVAVTIWKKKSDLTNLTCAYDKLWFIFQPLLFGIIGARTDFEIFDWTVIYKGVGCLLISTVVRIFASYLMTSWVDISFRERIFLVLAWTGKGTVQAALGPVALDTAIDLGLENEQLLAQQIMNIAAMIILLSSFSGFLALKFFGHSMLTR